MFEHTATAFLGKTNLEVTERFDEYRLVFEATDLAPGAALAQVQQLLSLVSELPTRDRFELLMDFAGDAFSVTASTEVGRASVATYFEGHHDRGDVRYELIIRKSVGGALSIYSPSALGHYLSTEKLSSVLTSLESRFSDGLDFECFCLLSGGSESLRFLSRGNPSTTAITRPMRSLVLTTFRDNSYSAGLETDFLPSDFYLQQRTGVADIDEFMDRACAVLCATYLATSSQISTPESLSYKLLGYKSVEGEVGFAQLVPALPGLYKIYDWAYGAGGSADRIGLARNVISLHVDRLEELSVSRSLWNAIQSNYQIYLRGNVASYLEVKSKIAEFLVESTAKAHALVEGLVESLKNSVFVMLTFLLTVVVVNGLKDNGGEVIFSDAYFWVVVMLCVVLSAWMIGAAFSAVRRFDNASQTISEVLKLGYGRVLASSEIADNVDPINVRNRTYLIGQCKTYVLYWLLIASVMVAGFGVGSLYFGGAPAATGEQASVITPGRQLVPAQAEVPSAAAVDSGRPAQGIGPVNSAEDALPKP